MNDTTIDIDATRDALAQQLDEAREAERLAIEALGAAVLATATGASRGNVSGKLQDAVEAARARRIGLEAALTAAGRQQSAAAAARQCSAREARAAELSEALDDWAGASREVEAALRAIAESKCGARLIDASHRVLGLTNDMQVSSLTPGGWLLIEGLTELRQLHERRALDLAGQAMQEALRGQVGAGLSEYVARMRRDLLAGFGAQPAEWLAEP
jgi:hypothetical protein